MTIRIDRTPLQSRVDQLGLFQLELAAIGLAERDFAQKQREDRRCEKQRRGDLEYVLKRSRERDSRRLAPFLFGLLATLGWLVILRYGVGIYWYSPLIPWAGCLGTLGLTEVARQGLKDAAVGNLARDRSMPSTMAGAAPEAAR